MTYDRWHGQRLLDRDGIAAAYPLGFGLSYTSFAIGDVAVTRRRRRARVRRRVHNTGARPGGHVVQVYATARPGSRPFLVGFARAEVAPGEQAPVGSTCRCAGWPGAARRLARPARRLPDRRRRERRRPGRVSLTVALSS